MPGHRKQALAILQDSKARRDLQSGDRTYRFHDKGKPIPADWQVLFAEQQFAILFHDGLARKGNSKNIFTTGAIQAVPTC